MIRIDRKRKTPIPNIISLKKFFLKLIQNRLIKLLILIISVN